MCRFTIRDVLWLTMLVGLSLGWWIDHRYAKAQAKLDTYMILSLVLDLHHFEHYLLNVPPADLDLEVLREHARGTRAKVKQYSEAYHQNH